VPIGGSSRINPLVRRLQPWTDSNFCHSRALYKLFTTSIAAPSISDNLEATPKMSSEEIAKEAKIAFGESQLILSTERIKALETIRQQLERQKKEILAANVEDVKVCSPFTTLAVG